ncbi:MAG TPA: S41 family peptidase [Chryseosolibacter sp.]|nr:S41 family peptidase [Chryseosolibacter sp.]
MENKYFKGWRAFAPVFSALLLLSISCSEDELRPVTPASGTKPSAAQEANAYVNTWIYKNMDYWYLWNDQLPEPPDQNQDPESYFKSLLHTEDRFSWIQENYHDLLNSLQGVSKEAGYEFVLYREKDGSNNVQMQILYIKPGSPADNTGLKRGDVITHVNNQQITTENYKDLLTSIKEDHSVKFKPLLMEERTFGELSTLSLKAVQYAEDPNYLHKVIEIGGKRIGYFIYNFFAGGTDSQPGKYDAEMDAIFADFKAKGISELVIDLRFNSGGSENSAKKLASLIGSGVDNSKIFLKRRYNDKVEDEILNDESLGVDYLTSEFSTEVNNIGNQLSAGRVYVLTSSRTASASELIINALKPFMDVFLIGDTTYGKNVGSVSLFQEKDPKNLWGMQPIVVKVYNSLDQSDYSAGFVPDILHTDNSLYLYPLGDVREALLGQAIAQITGTATTLRESRETRTAVGHSLDFKRRSYNLIMDSETLPDRAEE